MVIARTMSLQLLLTETIQVAWFFVLIGALFLIIYLGLIWLVWMAPKSRLRTVGLWFLGVLGLVGLRAFLTFFMNSVTYSVGLF